MNPLQKNKVDLATMNEQERQLFQKYGKLPKKNVLASMQKERKYFDSGDYAMHKAGITSPADVGSAIATPERLPHAQPPSLSSSPTNTSAMPPYAHMGHHAAASSSSAAAAPSGHVLSPSNSFSVSSPGIPIPGTAAAAGSDPTSAAKSPPRMASFSAQGGAGLSPTRAHALGPGSGLNARRPSVGVGIASIPIPGVPAGGSVGGFDTSRVSPPVTLSPLAHAVPPSSFPIQTSHVMQPPHTTSSSTSSSTPPSGGIPNIHPVATGTGAGGGHHHSASSFGHSASPGKPSHLKQGFDGRMTSDVVDEMAVED